MALVDPVGLAALEALVDREVQGLEVRKDLEDPNTQMVLVGLEVVQVVVLAVDLEVASEVASAEEAARSRRRQRKTGSEPPVSLALASDQLSWEVALRRTHGSRCHACCCRSPWWPFAVTVPSLPEVSFRQLGGTSERGTARQVLGHCSPVTLPCQMSVQRDFEEEGSAATAPLLGTPWSLSQPSLRSDGSHRPERC